MTNSVNFHLPTKPYSVVDAINRAAAAQGSFNYAMACNSADYNGHWITVAWNDYSGYYVCEHFYGGRVVHARTEDPAEIVREAVAEYKVQGRGASLHIVVKVEHAAIVGALGIVLPGEEPKDADWVTWRHKLVGEAISWEKHFPGTGIPALLAARDEAEFHYLKSHRGKDQLMTRQPQPDALAKAMQS